jgi:hypothetical protein
VIGDAGFTTQDDLVHGFVGGYLPPVLGDRSRMLEEVPDFTLEEGMTIVIQPNVVTPDESAGVQTGRADRGDAGRRRAPTRLRVRQAEDRLKDAERSQAPGARRAHADTLREPQGVRSGGASERV